MGIRDSYNIHALIDLFGKPVYHKYMANIERNIDTSGMMLFDFEHLDVYKRQIHRSWYT